jgi:hypothetical protein
MMTETFTDPHGRVFHWEEGDLVSGNGIPPPAWMYKRILSMNLLGQQLKNNVWELHLDCGHNQREICIGDESPKGQYRDCDTCHSRLGRTGSIIKKRR